MPDQFDVRREQDGAAAAIADEAMDRLADSKDKADEREGRLIQLDESHYFDPQNKQVLLKNGASYANLGHNPHFEELAAQKIEEEAGRKGYKPVKGGLFWDPAEMRLYAKNGGHYVLYALDRR